MVQLVCLPTSLALIDWSLINYRCSLADILVKGPRNEAEQALCKCSRHAHLMR